MSIDRGMDEDVVHILTWQGRHHDHEDLVHISSGISLSHKKALGLLKLRQ